MEGQGHNLSYNSWLSWPIYSNLLSQWMQSLINYSQRRQSDNHKSVTWSLCQVSQNWNMINSHQQDS